MKYEIIVWVKGHTTGHRFINKEQILTDEVSLCVAENRSFKLRFPGGAYMIFGADSVSHIQVTEMRNVT
jgi:hypothetical protein